MSRASVRGAIAAYLNTGVGGSNPIPSLQKIYRAMPTWIDPARWWVLPQGFPYGTVGFLHLAKDKESRIDFPAVTGQKLVGYTVTLVLIYRYLAASETQNPAAEGDEWVDGLDGCIEGIKALIRTDPNLGTAQATIGTGQPGVIYSQYPGAIWEAGQDEGDLELTPDLPALDQDTPGELIAFQVLDFHAYEVITA